LTYFQKKAQVSNFIQIHLVGGEGSMQMDRGTDMLKLVVAVRNFANVPKMGYICSVWWSSPDIHDIMYIQTCWKNPGFIHTF